MANRLALRLLIYALLTFTFFAGLPQFHYVVAIMISLIIRHKDHPEVFFTKVDSFELPLEPATRS